MEKFNRKFGSLMILLLANAIFFALYFRFFKGEAIYLYTDIGSDSVASSLPIINMLQRLTGAGDLSGYSVTAGLGSSTFVSLIKYLNPIKLPLLFFTGETLPLGLITELLIQVNVISLFSWAFFRRLLRHGTAALYAALCWTFSAYITLWSQNLTAGAAMACFTIMMAALLPALQRPSLRKSLPLAMAIGLFLLTDYYYCYMGGIFVIIFIIFYTAADGAGFPELIMRWLRTAGAALFGVLLAAVSLVPSLAGFAMSGRTNSFSSLSHAFFTLSRRDIFTDAARLFSANTLGAGSSYNGTYNYYEAALLSSSIIAVTAVIYLITREESRLITIAAVITAGAALYIKNTGAFIQFNSGVQRYSFMIVLAECIAIGAFIKKIMERPYGVPLFWSALAALTVEGGAVLFLAKKDGSFGFVTDLRTLKFVAIFAGAFALVFFLCSLPARISAAMPYIGLLVLAAELVVMNYDSVYLRSYVAHENYGEIAGAYGTEEAVSAIKSRDDSLFRISPGLDYAKANAGMLLDFPSASQYGNTNPASLTSFSKLIGSCEISPNHFLATGNEFGKFQFLSGKYLVRSASGLMSDTAPSAYYKKVMTLPGGEKDIYENTAALPFGYLYHKGVTAADMNALPLPQRVLALTQAYYLTDGISASADGADSEAEEPDVETADSLSGQSEASSADTASLLRGFGDLTVDSIMTQGMSPNNLKLRKTSTGFIFRPTGADPYTYFNIGAARPGSARFLYLKLHSTKFNRIRMMQIFFMKNENDLPDPADSQLFYIGRGYPEVCLLLPDDVKKIRLDFPEDFIDTHVSELAIISSAKAASAFDELASTDVTGISMEGGRYTATVTDAKGGMFCVPLLWTRGFTATVNGEKAAVQNINGGLIGIEVPSGTSEIVLTYRGIYMRAAAIISACALLIWIILFFMPLWEHKED